MCIQGHVNGQEISQILRFHIKVSSGREAKNVRFVMFRIKNGLNAYSLFGPLPVGAHALFSQRQMRTDLKSGKKAEGRKEGGLIQILGRERL